jgi:carbon-monoxide dehydrogenase small subunit
MIADREVTLTVNGERVTHRIEPRQNLVDFLREKLGLTGSHVGCEHGICGACTIRLNGMLVRGCLTLAIQAEGAEIQTIEGISDSGEIAVLQAAFLKYNALQCGFCTPAMLLTAAELLEENPSPSREEIRQYLSGNYCRCTGYQSIVDAVEDAARTMAGGSS